MAYSEENKLIAFNTIIENISENCMSLRNALLQDGMPSSKTFYIWLDEDEDKVKQYARACEIRADKIFDDILDIADDTSRDKRVTEAGEVTDNEVIQRSRLRVDARKWYLSKLSPKKYGDKLDVTTDGEKINSQPPIFGNNPLDGQ